MNPNLADLLRNHVAQRPDAPCLSYAGETLSYRQLDTRSNRVANALLAAGVPSGGRVAIVARNSAVFYELAFACAKAGTVMLPLNWRLSAREIAAILEDAQPALILVEGEFSGLLPATTAARVVALDDAYPAWRDAAAAAAPAVSVAPDDVALLLYTSGTTGQPKGVMLSHRNLSYSALMAREVWGFKPTSVNLVAMPLFHIGGMGYGLMALTQGGHTVLMQQPAPVAVLETVQRYRVTHGFFVPAVIQALVNVEGVDKMNLESLQLMVYGASPISETLLLRAIEVFGCGFSHAYGLTETAGTVITLAPQDHDPGGAQAARLRSCGRPLDWVEAGLFDPESKQPVARGEVGEIWIRSAMNMLGYWNKPSETTATILEDGWLRTGDAAYQDADGYYYIHDRYKDMIVSGGENVYPTEIENLLYEHPGVAEAAVIGVPHPRWGETPRAIIVPRSGAELSATDIIAFLRQRLAHYKCPSSVEFVESLPRSASGKILKRELRAQSAQSQGEKP